MKTYSGFTLIELLIVVAIIGVLSTIVIGSVNSARQKGMDAATIANLANIRAQSYLYLDTNSSYGPPGTGTITSTGATSGLAGVCAASDVQSMLGRAASVSGNTVTCIIGQSGNSWLAYVTLKSQASPESFCVDSNGAKGILPGPPLEESPFQAVACK